MRRTKFLKKSRRKGSERKIKEEEERRREEEGKGEKGRDKREDPASLAEGGGKSSPGERAEEAEDKDVNHNM